MLNNWLLLSPRNQNEVLVHDCLYDEDYIIENRIASYIRKLNGRRNPYSISTSLSKHEIMYLLIQLREYNLIRTGRVSSTSIGSVYITLWYIKSNSRLKAFARVWNNVLIILWLPVLLAGLVAFLRYLPIENTSFMWIGNIIGIVVGILLHELGHAFAGIAYNAEVFELGIMLKSFLPGAYVLMNEKKVSSRIKRIQINAAGVESNALFAGLSILIACVIPFVGGICISAAITNILLFFINSSFIVGFDGFAILSELLGMKNLVEDTRIIVFNSRIREKLRLKGVQGYLMIVMSVIVQSLRITFPLIIGWDIMEVISCFIK